MKIFQVIDSRKRILQKLSQNIDLGVVLFSEASFEQLFQLLVVLNAFQACNKVAA